METIYIIAVVWLGLSVLSLVSLVRMGAGPFAPVLVMPADLEEEGGEHDEQDGLES